MAIESRSACETPLGKQVFSSPSSTRKSERLEKRFPIAPSAKGESKRFVNQRSPNPLRQSKEGDMVDYVNFLVTKKPNYLKKLSPEVAVVSRTKRRDVESVSNRDARAYRALFRPKKVDIGFSEVVSTLADRGGKCSSVVGNEIDGGNKSKTSSKWTSEESNSSSLKIINGMVGNQDKEKHPSPKQNRQHVLNQLDFEGEKDFQIPSTHLLSDPEIVCNDTIDGSKGVQANCSVKKKLQDPVFIQSSQDCKTIGGGCQSSSSKLIWNDAAFNSDACDIEEDVPSLACCMEKSNCVDTSTSNKKERFQSTLSNPNSSCCPVDVERQICQSSFSMDTGVLDICINPGIADACNTMVRQRLSPSKKEVNVDPSTCFICKLGGDVLCCVGKGCRRSFHSSCLDPHLDEIPIKAWFCFWCVRKKTEFGVHSRSEGVESIWDVREFVVSDVEGLSKEKQYFVKYKSLAHIHNRWVPESQLRLESPALLSKFNGKNQVIEWMEEWTVPHHLLQKRLSSAPMNLVGSDGKQTCNNNKICHYEWLVKWRGQDYDHLTWELDTASFRALPEVERLIEEYENRHKNAKNASDLSKTHKENGLLCKVLKLPDRMLQGSDTNYLDCINILIDKWHTSKNCIVFDDKSNAYHPFLIITTTAALTSWEREFLNSAPSVYTVVYSGSKQTRELIRKVEFFGDRGSVLFQVILSSPEVISEDLEALKTLRWEAIIVDACVRSKMPIHFEQFRMLISDMRLVLYSGQTKVKVSNMPKVELFTRILQDKAAGNPFLVSFIGEDGDVEIFNGAETGSNVNIGSVKERLSHKYDSCRFVEYWVPVLLSDFQLEQYCSILLSNVMSLQSSSKNDPCGALRDVILSIRQCFDHPYIVDSGLEKKLTIGFQQNDKLDFEIKASGKLQLLDTILSEIKNKGLRALILSRASSGKDVIGNILEDFLLLRFGKDSYERLSGGALIPFKLKQATLKRFNDKGNGRFVFLLENRNVPNIKLSSVDVVILFNSDLNPINDLRAFQKITIEQTEQIKLFRLYYPFTIEEKFFIQYKQKQVIVLETMSRIASQQLLMWGASYLFKKLDDFHDITTLPVDVNSEPSSFNGSVKELLALLSQPSDRSNTMGSSISKVHQTVGTYNQYDIVFPGELEIQVTNEKQPHLFWIQLLQGRRPKWKYMSEASVRTTRKRVLYTEETYTEEMPKQTTGSGNYSSVKKRKKTDKGNLVSLNMECTANLPVDETQSMPESADFADHSTEVISKEFVQSVENGNPHVAQNNLHLHLKPELSKLCDVLLFPADAKSMAQWYLDYIMRNLAVSGDSATILQALQISLCWIVASKLSIEIDHENSVVHARQHLNFCCELEEVKTVFSKLLENLPSSAEHIWEDDILNDFKSRGKDIEDNLHTCVSHPTTDERCMNMVPENSLATQGFPEKRKKLILEEYNKKLEQHQLEEIKEFEKGCVEKNAEINNLYRMEVDVILKMYRINSVKSTLLRHLEKVFAAKREEHERKMTIDRGNIIVKQHSARNDMHLRMDHSLQNLPSLVQFNSLHKSSLHKSGSLLKDSGSHEKSDAHACVESVPMSENLPEERTPNHVMDCSHIIDVTSSEINTSIPSQTVSSDVEVQVNTITTISSDAVEDILDITTDCNYSKENRPEVAMEDTADLDLPPNISVNASNEELVSSSPLVIGSSKEVDVALDGPIVLDTIQGDRADSCDVDTLNNPLSTEAQIMHGDITMTDVEQVSESNDDAECNVIQEILTTDSRLFQINNSEQPIIKALCSTAPSTQSVGNGVPDDGVQTSNTGIALVTSSEAEDSIVHLVDCLQPDTSPCEAGILEACVQPEQLKSIFPPICHSEQDSVTTNVLERLSEVSTEPPPSLVSQAVLNECSLSSSSQEQTAVCNPFNLDVSIRGCDPSPPVLPQSWNLHFDENQECSSLVGIEAFSVNTQAPPQSVEDTVEVMDASVPPLSANISPCEPEFGRCNENTHAWTSLVGNDQGPISNQTSGFNNRVSGSEVPFSDATPRMELGAQISQPQVTQNPPPAAFCDPLQTEMEGFEREMEKAKKTHDDLKLALKSEYEKEMEEAMSRIRSKYESKLGDAEAAFFVKQKDLDSKHENVLKNKILAETFRSKCSDRRISEALPISKFFQAFPSTSMKQYFHSWVQQHLPRAAVPSPARPSPAANLPPIQTVHHSASLFSRPPHHPPSPSPLALYQASGGIRCPAPHHQFRPPLPAAPPPAPPPPPPPPAAPAVPQQAVFQRHNPAPVSNALNMEAGSNAFDVCENLEVLEMAAGAPPPMPWHAGVAEVVCLSDDE